MAFDIECTKPPLKFPSAETDEIFMISYMCAGRGFLALSRSVVSGDVANFEYTPRPQYPGPFTVFNEPDESSLLRRFFEHFRQMKPQIVVTYNGDFFDWPFLETRAAKYGLDMKKELGICLSGQATSSTGGGVYRGRCCVHLDAFHWVKRDSYLPHGAHGLKAVTNYKLGYDPFEVDPEDMVKFASSSPGTMARYSVSDSVSTYYLYDVYVHLFIFSLCTVIPMGPEDVLRKGSGTLCETLLMAEAFRCNVICPNKHHDPDISFYKGRVLENETYVGGHVECLETGVFRSDLPVRFRLSPNALQGLIDHVDRDLAFAVEVEAGIERMDIVNYDEVKGAIVEKLEMLRDSPVRMEEPHIMHLDVGAMYPNIILTNRLQPGSIVDRAACAACEFNTPDAGCKRLLKWVWRGDVSMASPSEYQSVVNQLSYEMVDGVPFNQLPSHVQTAKIKQRLNDYSRKVYRKAKNTIEGEHVDTVCMRENAFYVNTVRAFRDRRYEYKLATKHYKKESGCATDTGERKSALDKAALYDSLSTAHKCILNSFYGYVMRKGARWHSMQMAGIVTYTGASLITQARELVEQIGRPLELDTDGIWCILPRSFPDTFSLQTSSGNTVNISYPCAILNTDVHERYTNHQYQELKDAATRQYATREECSIFFEVDGPYRCMVLPSSTEEGRLLKKRYAVFNMDGSIAELKGFELKRRGELEIVKNFQSQVFEKFLEGSDLMSCFSAVAEVANHWLDIIDRKGMDLDHEEVIQLISEKKTISQTLADYGNQKSTSLTTARRLADFLGEDMVKDKGLNCRLIIANRPAGAPVTERAIPTEIFSAKPKVMRHFMCRWMKDTSMDDFDIRSVLDWDYYRDRLGKSIQKIITIPAAMQRVTNPVPRIRHPDWLRRVIREKNDSYKQLKVDSMFSLASKLKSASNVCFTMDVEDMGSNLTVGVPSSRNVNGTLPVGRRHHKLPLQGGHAVGKGSSTTVKGGVDEDDDTSNNHHKSLVANPPLSLQPFPQNGSGGDVSSWLVDTKRLWKMGRAKRLASRAGLGGGSELRKSYGNSSMDMLRGDGKKSKGRSVVIGEDGGIASFLQAAEDALLHGSWQIIAVSPSTAPGDYVLWVMTGQKELHKVIVSVPRALYINSRKSPPSGAIGKEVTTHHLPRGRRPIYLREVTLSEEGILQHDDAVTALFRDPDVEGVYGLQTPLDFKIVVLLGCLARVTLAGRKRAAESRREGIVQRFQLDDLEFISTAKHPYLSPEVASYRRVYIYGSFNKGLGVLGIFFLDETTSGSEQPFNNTTFAKGMVMEQQPPIKAIASVWFVAPKATAIQQLPLGRLFDSLDPPPGSSCSFKMGTAKTVESALTEANIALTAYHQSMPGATIIVAQLPVEVKESACRVIPALTNFPVVHMPINVDDSRFPALGWQSFAAQRMLRRLSVVEAWFQDRILSARYAHIPIANLGDDAPVSMADVMFARQLDHNRCISWASPLPWPDLGGAEQDDYDLWADGLSSPTLSVPGAYRTVCIEMSIFGLSVGSIMASGELEGGGGGDSDVGNDEFKLLRIVVSKWLGDAASRGDAHADALLHHLYRWLCAEHALMREPSIYRIVHRLMRKLFARLIAELQRLGAKVVFASFEKVIIATNKSSAAAAQDYVSFVADTVTSGDLFTCLQLTPIHMWQSLLFFDNQNYGGIGLNDGDNLSSNEPTSSSSTIIQDDKARLAAIEDIECGGVEEDEEDNDGNDNGTTRLNEMPDNDNEVEGRSAAAGVVENSGGESSDREEVGIELPPIVSHWNIAESLHPSIRELLLVFVGEFLLRPWQKRREMENQHMAIVASLSKNKNNIGGLKSQRELFAPVEGSNRTMVIQERLMQEMDKSVIAMEAFMQDMMTTNMTPRVLTALSSILRLSQDWGGGKHALNFVKTLYQILSLDATVEVQAENLRMQALASLGVRAFASEAQFVDSHQTLILPDVICSFCNLCSDLDLCRDPSITSADPEDRWLCPRCGTRHDVPELERRLVEVVLRESTRFQLQDLRCSTAGCGMVSTSCLRQTCSCSSALTFEPGHSPDDIHSKLKLLRDFSQFHDMPWLLETTDSTLSLDGYAAAAEEETNAASKDQTSLLDIPNGGTERQ